MFPITWSSFLFENSLELLIMWIFPAWPWTFLASIHYPVSKLFPHFLEFVTAAPHFSVPKCVLELYQRTRNSRRFYTRFYTRNFILCMYTYMYLAIHSSIHPFIICHLFCLCYLISLFQGIGKSRICRACQQTGSSDGNWHYCAWTDSLLQRKSVSRFKKK